MRSDADRLSDILEAIAKIRERITDSIHAFQDDEMLQVWAIHHLQVTGEAARGVSQSLKDRHPEAPWPRIVALRNILVKAPPNWRNRFSTSVRRLQPIPAGARELAGPRGVHARFCGIQTHRRPRQERQPNRGRQR